MGYIAIADLKKTKVLSQKLENDNELIVTRDGKPMAILISVNPDDVESSLSEIRRARFSAAVTRIRERASENPPDLSVVDRAGNQCARFRTHECIQPAGTNIGDVVVLSPSELIESLSQTDNP